MAFPPTILRLRNLAPGAARARAARYAALSAACRAAGLVDLLLGHHAGDQAETVLMRQRRGSGPDGLAGMAALVETDDIRLVRPLLGIEPSRLRTLVAAAGLVPVEDPTNSDLRTTRARLRQEIGTDRADLLAVAARGGPGRGRGPKPPLRPSWRPACKFIRRGSRCCRRGRSEPGPLLRCSVAWPGGVSRWAHVAALAACPRAATVAGVQLLPAGRLGPGWLLVREAAAMEAAIAARPGGVWDGRYRVAEAQCGSKIGPLGSLAGTLRDVSRLPFSVLRTLPAFLVQQRAIRCAAFRL